MLHIELSRLLCKPTIGCAEFPGPYRTELRTRANEREAARRYAVV